MTKTLFLDFKYMDNFPMQLYMDNFPMQLYMDNFPMQLYMDNFPMQLYTDNFPMQFCIAFCESTFEVKVFGPLI